MFSQSSSSLHASSSRTNIDVSQLRSVGADDSHLSVRERGRLQKLEELRVKEQEYVQRQARHAEALRMREMNKEDPIRDRVQLWAHMLVFAVSLHSWKRFMTTTTRRRNVQRVFFPIMVVRVRRWIRQCRVRLMLQNIDQPIRCPTVADLRTDRMLALFPDAHLQNMIDGAVLRYYYKDESIVFMGCEEDECFFLVSGTAEVVMNGTCVYTLTPGMMFGTVGMISGEPRTATIIGRSPVFVWAFTRSTFEQFGACSAEQLDVAKDVINQLRQQNLLNVYQPMLSPAALGSRFTSLSTVDDEFVRLFVDSSHPEVIPEQTVVVSSSRHPAETDVVLVMRGKVSVYLTQSPNSIVTGRTMDEQIALSVEGPIRRRGTLSSTSNILDSLKSFTVSSPRARSCIAELDAPLLIGLSSAVLGERQPLEFRAGPRGCDILRQKRSWILSFDILDLASLRKAAIDVHCRFMPPLDPSVVHRAMVTLDSSPRTDGSGTNLTSLTAALSSLKPCIQTSVIEPCVFLPGEIISFEQSTNFRVVFIVAGELESTTFSTAPSFSHPIMWPELSMVFFGSLSTSRRVKSRVEAYCVPRQWIVEGVIKQSPSNNQFEHCIKSLALRFTAMTHITPVFDSGDLFSEDVTGGGGGEMSILRERLRLARKLCTELRVPEAVSTTTKSVRENSSPVLSPPDAREVLSPVSLMGSGMLDRNRSFDTHPANIVERNDTTALSDDDFISISEGTTSTSLSSTLHSGAMSDRDHPAVSPPKTPSKKGVGKPDTSFQRRRDCHSASSRDDVRVGTDVSRTGAQRKTQLKPSPPATGSKFSPQTTPLHSRAPLAPPAKSSSKRPNSAVPPSDGPSKLVMRYESQDQDALFEYAFGI